MSIDIPLSSKMWAWSTFDGFVPSPQNCSLLSPMQVIEIGDSPLGASRSKQKTGYSVDKGWIDIANKAIRNETGQEMWKKKHFVEFVSGFLPLPFLQPPLGGQTENGN